MFSAWKLIPTLLIVVALAGALLASPPRGPVRPGELGRLVVAIGALYGVGLVALLAGRITLGAIVFGAGLTVCALALWLSRGGGTPPADDDGDDGGGPPHQPAPEPPPSFDWQYYEDQFREPASTSPR